MWLTLVYGIFSLFTPQPAQEMFALLRAQPSQEVLARFESETLTPLTGQPFVMTLTVETPPGVILADWPIFGEIWGKFEVQSVAEKLTTPLPGGGALIQQSLTVILWRPEDAVTPETFISYGLGGDEVRRVPVRELFISVTTVVDPLAPELIPARPLIQPTFPVWIIAVVVAIVTALVYGVTQSRRPQAVEIPLSAAERAVKALNAIQLDLARPASDRLREAVALLAGYGREVALSDGLSTLIRAGEEVAYSGNLISDGQVRGFITRAATLLTNDAGRDE